MKYNPTKYRLLKIAVWEKDGEPNACMVPAGLCVCNDYQRMCLSPHHFLKRSRYPRETYNPHVCITIGAGCHYACERGTTIDGKRITADEFNLLVLAALRETSYWRWDYVVECLNKKGIEIPGGKL